MTSTSSPDEGVLHAERRRRAGLALTGCAVGDCLGIPFENRRRPPSGWQGDRFEYASPRWTDDTQQSLVLVDDILRHGTLDATRVMDRFVAMAHAPSAWPHAFGLHRGTGRGFRFAVDHYAAHGQFGPMPDRAGNGAAMRMAAAAVALGESDDARRQLTAMSAATHAHPAAIDAARAVAEVAWAFSRGVRGDDVIAETLVRLPAGLVHRSLSAALRAGDPFEAIVHEAEAAMGERPRHGAGDGHALCSPLAALFIAARMPLFEGLQAAVRLGGDTDSTAAIVGGLRAPVDDLDDLPAALLAFPGADVLARWGKGPLPDLDTWWGLERDLSVPLP